MSKLKEFLARKDIVISPQRYLIDALGAMAQGLFASLLIGTIIKTVGQQTGLALLVDLGGYATAMSGPAMACAIGWALHCPPLVLFSLITVGYSANCAGRRRRPAGRADHCHCGGRAGQGREQGDQGGYPCHPAGDHFCGAWGFPCSSPRPSVQPPAGGHPDHVGHRAGSAGHGHSGVGHHGRGADPAHLLCRHLRCTGPDRPCRRRCRGRLLRPDGGLCRDEL